MNSKLIWMQIEKVMKQITRIFQEIYVKHTIKSLWFENSIKSKIDHLNIDKNIFFSFIFKSILINFDKTIRKQLNAIKIKMTKNDENDQINKTRMMFIIRQYRIAFNIFFMMKFWNDFENVHIHMTNVDIIK